MDSLGFINSAPIDLDHRIDRVKVTKAGRPTPTYGLLVKCMYDGSAISRDACCKEMYFQIPLIREWKIPKAT